MSRNGESSVMICISRSPMFCLPSKGYVKILLEFLIQHDSYTKSNKEVSFHAVSYSRLVVMISSSLISCICKLFFARKKIYNFSSSSLKIKCVFFPSNDLIIKIVNKLISLRFVGVKLSKEI